MLFVDAMVLCAAGTNNGRKEEDDTKGLRRLRAELWSASLES